MPMKKGRARFLWAALGLLAAAGFSPAWAGGAREPVAMPSKKAFQLQLAFRDLWESRLFWVRSAVQEERDADIEAGKVSEARVIQGSRDLADAFSPWYGDDFADKLFGLLAGHDKALKDYGEAAIRKDTVGQHAAAGVLSANAGEAATLLASANPGWRRDVLEKMLATQAEQQEKQITDFFAADFNDEADGWTAMKRDTYYLADTLALGIVKQFPAKF
jgi:hypothetical protein